MVALLVGLRWRQLGHQLGRNPWLIVTLIITGMTALGLLAFLTVGLATLRFAAPEAAVTATVLLGSVIVAGWWIGSILVSADDSLAPERFALLPVTARSLLPGLVVAGATTVGGVGTTLALLLMLVGWSTSIPALLAALLTIPLALATCVLGARVVSGLLAGWLSHRRTRDLVLTLGVLLVACSGLLLNVVIGAVSRMSDAVSGLASVADVVAWTPVGAVFGFPASLARGDLPGAGLRLLIALATVWALWLAARALLGARLIAPIQSEGGGRVRSGGLIDRMLPASPVGAIAARTLRYSRRDPRHAINTVMLLLLPAILVGVVVMNGLREDALGFGAAIVLVPSINALLIGTMVQMATAYDNDALALHILSGVGGTADRLGRLLGLAVVVVPLTVVLCAASCLLAGRMDLLPASLGSAVGLTAASAGAGAWIGVFLPGRAPAPEANPLGRGSSGGVQSMVAMLAMAPLTVVVGGPAFGFAIAALWNPVWGWVSLGCGLLLGGAAVGFGAVLGGRALDRRWPQVLAEVSES